MTDWIELKPKTYGGPGVPLAPVRFEILQGRKSFSARLLLCGAMTEAFPLRARVRVMAAGRQLLVRLDPKGPFAIAKPSASRLGIALPHFPGLPAHRVGPTPCEVETCDDGAIIVTIPDDLPEHAPIPRATKPKAAPPATSAAPAPRAPGPVQAAPAPEPVLPAHGKVDVVEQLLQAGHECKRVAGGRIQIDGDAYTLNGAANVANRGRIKAGLEALSVEAFA